MLNLTVCLGISDPVPFPHCSVVGLAYRQKHPIKAYEIVGGGVLDPAAQVTKNVLTVKQLLTPLSREQLGIVRCLGLNYGDHAVRILFSLTQ